MKKTPLQVVCDHSGLHPDTVTKCYPWVLESCELYANQPAEKSKKIPVAAQWKVDSGMDELREDNFRISVYDTKHNQIHVFGTTPGETEKFANTVCNALNHQAHEITKIWQFVYDKAKAGKIIELEMEASKHIKIDNTTY